jgi:N-acetylmuramoyl-L-alanine amidase
LNKAESGSSVFIMKEEFGSGSSPSDVSRDQMFLPWYLGYRTRRQSSATAANMFQEELNKLVPGSKVPVRMAPLAILSSATMPSLMIEIGNLNNPNDAQNLTETTFQAKLIDSIVTAVQRFSGSPQAAAN